MKIRSILTDYIRNLLSNPAARVPFVLLGGAIMNLIYIATNAASAVLYRSLWSATLIAYHLILITIRLYLLSAGRRSVDNSSAIQICRRVGILMLFLDLTCAVIIIYSISLRNFADYSGLIFFGFLLFTVYSLTRSVTELRKHKDSENRLYYTARSISLCASLMSVFNLEYSLFSLLGADFSLIGRAIFLSGLAVFSVILFLSLRLMRPSVKE